MKYDIQFTNQFKKDLKLAKKQNKNLDKLFEVINILADGGTLEAKDVPAVWAKLYKEYLGIEVPNDRDGCLQDSHWSGGAFGYFPSYALGSAYGAQMLRRMEQDVDVWGAAAKGDLTPITAWLREKVHQYGGLMEPADVVKNACGDFSAEDYIQYLTRKYTGLYDL